MTLNCYRFTEGPELMSCDYSYALDSIRQKNGKIWIDIMDAGTSELEEKLDDLNVHGLIRQLSLESGNHPGLYPIKPMVLLVMPVLKEEKDSRNMEYLTTILSHDFLLTFHNKEFVRFQKKISFEDSDSLLPDNSITGIISILMLGFSMASIRKASLLSDIILSMEQQMDQDPGSVTIAELSERQSEILTFESVVKGQLLILEAIVSSQKIFKHSENTMEYMVLATSNLNSSEKKLDWLSHRVEVIRSLIDMYGQEKTNRRLARLTILSTIFMPITFLAGIWGMNFESMPGLRLPYGYVLALCTMTTIAASMYFYFRRRRWFD